MATDDQRFERVYRTYGRDIIAYCARRLPRDEAHDAAADVFAVAWRRIDDMPAGSGALPWLYGVARMVISNRARTHRRVERLIAKLRNQRPRAMRSPEHQVVRQAEIEALLVALDRLPEADQEILRLVEWEGVDRKVVAEMFGVSRAAINQRISRSYKRLSRQLSQRATVQVPVAETVEEGNA